MQLPHYGTTPPACPVCGAQITIHQSINPGHCGARTCLSRHAVRAAVAREAALVAERQDRIDAAVRGWPEAIVQSARTLGADLDSLRMASVPFQTTPVRPLPDERRAEFLTHLDGVVHAAFDALQAEPPSDDEDREVAAPDLNRPQPVEALGCATCQGHCCQLGGKAKAFLSVKEIQTQARAHPDLGPQEMIDRYADALPATSVKDACVFQSAQGCVLPRGWRASPCNTYRCHSLRTLSTLADASPDAPLVIVGVTAGEAKITAYRDSLGGRTIHAAAGTPRTPPP
ncbi:hypothetical protein [Sulfitobacter sabulilitoris]|uniref:Uncharacterized protein n=1 Tax=Sulfitobacter sabulilitoris TaxID=2562655 RepID=A0A5S3PNQ8_9RHOB|nr:hypothetical protein [Sulfitobacter sabulilitoris]TMM54145.1 hypothetical protein FDT80_00635 [Sulfitobacter sabulilitoris]